MKKKKKKKKLCQVQSVPHQLVILTYSAHLGSQCPDPKKRQRTVNNNNNSCPHKHPQQSDIFFGTLGRRVRDMTDSNQRPTFNIIFVLGEIRIQL